MHGGALVFGLRFVADVLGLCVSSLAIVLLTQTSNYLRSHIRALGRFINGDTEFNSAPSFKLDHVPRDELFRMLGLPQEHGSRSRPRNLLCRIDVKYDYLLQILVDPPERRLLGSTWSAATWSWVCVCSSGGVVAPRFWGLVVSALEHAHTYPTLEGEFVPPQGVASAEHVGFSHARVVPVASTSYRAIAGLSLGKAPIPVVFSS